MLIDDSPIILQSLEAILKSILKSYGLDMEIIFGYDGVDMLKYIIEDQKEGNKLKWLLLSKWLRRRLKYRALTYPSKI